MSVFYKLIVCFSFLERRWLREGLLFRKKLQKIQRSDVTWV